MTKRRLALQKLLADPAADTPVSAAPTLTATDPATDAREGRVRSGAVRSMGLALDRLADGDGEGARIVELDPALCEAAFVRDRLEDAPSGDGNGNGERGGGEGDPAGLAALARSIEEGGQAVPILVRPSPVRKGHYQIAYGHRRWRACAMLGRPVRAIVRALDDEALVIAQARENSERRDLTFIERATFAHALLERGLSRAVIGRALGVDKSELARLLGVASGLPEGLAERIGRAPKAGRPRWLRLATLCQGEGKGALALETAGAAAALPTDARFTAVLNALEGIQAAAPDPKEPLPVMVKTTNQRTIITIDEESAPEFGRYVEAQLAALFAKYRAGHKGRASPQRRARR